MTMQGGFRNPLTTTATLADGAVTTPKVANLAITTAKIDNLAVTNAKIDNLAVTAAKIANATITAAKIANATITNAQIANATITSAKITNLTALLFRTKASGERLEIDGTTGESFIRMYNTGGTEVGRMGYDASGFGTNILGIGNTSGVGGILLNANGSIELFAGGAAGQGVIITNPDPVGGVPSIPFRVAGPSGNTGAGFQVHDSNAVGTPTWAFALDSDTGIRRGTFSNNLFVVAGGADVGIFINGSIQFPGRATTTNSGLAAWRNDGFPGTHLLALSSSQADKIAIRNADPQPWLEKLDLLQPRLYRSKASADDGRKVILGLVKEEAEQVWPNWTYEAMNVPMLMAIQDLRTRVMELENA